MNAFLFPFYLEYAYAAPLLCLFACVIILCLCCVSVCVSTGDAVTGEIDKMDKVEPNKSASAGVSKTTKNSTQRAVKVAAVKESRSVRSKRRVSGEGKPALVLLIFKGEFCMCLAAWAVLRFSQYFHFKHSKKSSNLANTTGKSYQCRDSFRK